MKIDKDDQVKSFAEKPNENELDNFKTNINEEERYLASMGIYIFNIRFKRFIIFKPSDRRKIYYS